MPRNSGFTPDQKIRYLFIDAGYLNFRILNWAKYFDGNKIEINFRKLTKGYNKIFYYDGIAQNDSKKIEELNSLREIDNFHVFTGTTKGEGKKKKQKQVDVLITVNMLMHTIRNNMDSCTLLAGDEDFKPLIDALVQEGMNVTIWSERTSASKNLLYSADRRKELSLMQIWQLSTNEFQEKYPYPKFHQMSLGEKHSMLYYHNRRGTANDKDVFDLSEKGNVSIALETERSSGSVSYIQVTVNSEEELNRYLSIHGLSINWNDESLN